MPEPASVLLAINAALWFASHSPLVYSPDPKSRFRHRCGKQPDVDGPNGSLPYQWRFGRWRNWRPLTYMAALTSDQFDARYQSDFAGHLPRSQVAHGRRTSKLPIP